VLLLLVSRERRIHQHRPRKGKSKGREERVALAPVVPKTDVGDEFLIGKNDVEQVK